MYQDGWGGRQLQYENGWPSFNPSADFQYGRAVTLQPGAQFAHREPFITGAQGGSQVGSEWDHAFMWTYFEDSPFTPGWDARHDGGGPFISDSAPEHEGRAIVVREVDGDGRRSIYITGVSTVSGEGRQFTTMRFKE